MEGEVKKLLKLSPYADEKVWGGELLKKIKNIKSSNAVGETFEISTLQNQNSYVGEVELSRLVDDLPYLVKLIETTDNLSIQVHPGDEYAKRVEKSRGKTECWLILSANEGAGIYLGFKPGVSPSIFKSAIEKGDSVNKLLEFHPVKPGDFFYVPSGSIHAIGVGILMAEVQQSCGVTYRVWDWNRKGLDGKPRDLHIDKAMDVINFEELKNKKSYFQFKENVFDHGEILLASHEDFHFKLVKNKGDINPIGSVPNGLINFSKNEVEIQQGNEKIKLKYLECALTTELKVNLKINGNDILIGQVY